MATNAAGMLVDLIYCLDLASGSELGAAPLAMHPLDNSRGAEAAGGWTGLFSGRAGLILYPLFWAHGSWLLAWHRPGSLRRTYYGFETDSF